MSQNITKYQLKQPIVQVIQQFVHRFQHYTHKIIFNHKMPTSVTMDNMATLGGQENVCNIFYWPPQFIGRTRVGKTDSELVQKMVMPLPVE